MELSELFRILWVRKWFVLAVAVTVAVAAFLFSALKPPVYDSQARLLFAERDANAALMGEAVPSVSSQPERGVQTIVQLVRSPVILGDVIDQLKLDTDVDTLAKQVDVNVVGGTNIIAVSVKRNSPKEAANVANAVAERYVDWAREAKLKSLRDAADEVQARLDSAKERVLATSKQMSGKDQADTQRAELQIATASYSALAQRLEQLRVGQRLETGGVQVVSPAVPKPTPIAPKPMRNGMVGLVVGLVLGAGVTLLIDRLDTTVRTEEELEKLAEAPVLAQIPLEKQREKNERSLTLVEDPASAGAEAYRLLRYGLDFVNFEKQYKSILVTSPGPGDGKSTVASNLALSLAQAGEKVVLVCCDFRLPTTQTFFNMKNNIGLTDVLKGTVRASAAMQRWEDLNLLVLMAGQMPPNPSELLASQRMRDTVDGLKEWADWVILDAPPLLAVSDAAALAQWADGVVMVARSGKSSKDAVASAVGVVTNVGGRIIGTCLTCVPQTSASLAAKGSYADYYNASHKVQQALKTRDPELRVEPLHQSNAEEAPSLLSL